MDWIRLFSAADTDFPQKLLTFSGKYGDERVSKSA
jgi:hypothetical protein